jgi:hypothetical protein
VLQINSSFSSIGCFSLQASGKNVQAPQEWSYSKKSILARRISVCRQFVVVDLVNSSGGTARTGCY